MKYINITYEYANTYTYHICRTDSKPKSMRDVEVIA